MLQHPIYPLIISIFTLVLVVMQSIQNEKVLKFRMVIAFFDVAVTVFVFSIYEQMVLGNQLYEEMYMTFNFVVYGIFVLVMYGTFRTSVLKANHYQLFVKSIKNSKWNAYYVVDKKERIKDISSSLLIELNMEKEDVIGKKLFQVFNQAVRFTKFNNTEVNNKQLENFYLEYRKQAKIGDQEIQELSFLNSEGDPVILHMVMQPVFVMGKYRGRISVGEKKTDFDMLAVERELSQRSVELESIKHKFIATLDLSEEGLFYIDLDERSIWCSDHLVQTLRLPGNLLDLTDFRRLIEPEDLKKYIALVGELTLSKRQYQTSFRMMVNGQYVWFKEKGIRLFDDQHSATIMGTLKPQKTRHFQASNIDELDLLKDKNDFMVNMNRLFKEGKYFQCMIFKLGNMQEINETHGREVGNMLMAEYIKKMRTNFVTESGGIYRISGVEFAVIMTDPRKIDVLENGTASSPKFLNIEMQYGSIHAHLEVYAGIAIGGSDAREEHALYQVAMQALKLAESPKYSSQVCYAKDIQL